MDTLSFKAKSTLESRTYWRQGVYRTRMNATVGRHVYRVCISRCMKRLNPKTKQPFKLGDVHEGMVFYNYRTDVLANGFRGERWLSLEAFQRALERDKAAKCKKRRQAGKLPRVFKMVPAHV